MIPDIESVCFFPVTELSSIIIKYIMIPSVSIAVRGIKPFAPKFISCVFLHNPSVVTYIPRAVILSILLSVWNISSSPYSRSRLSFVNGICDGGPIIIQRAVEIKSGDTPEILQRRVMEQAEWHILPQAVNLFCNDKIKVIGNTTEILE